MTNSWVEPIPSQKTDESTANVHHFNPIENLLIEHASKRKCLNKIDIYLQFVFTVLGMSVYEQIASRTRYKRHRKAILDNLLGEQVEGDGDDDDDDRSSVILQVSLPIHFNMKVY